MARRPGRTRRRGFTLIELVCSMSVLALLSVVTSRVVLSAADQYMAAAARLELTNEMSGAMERITTELRQIPLSDATTADLVSMTPSSIGWRDSTGTRTLALSGGQVISTDSTGSAVLIANATAFSVKGYDDAAAALPATPSAAQLATVRRLEVSVTCARQGVTETLRTRVFLRMLMSGGGV